MKLKTLKDLQRFEDLKHSDHFIVSSVILKQEAIKWVKEDFDIMDNGKYIDRNPIAIIRRWMERLDIIEEDLV